MNDFKHYVFGDINIGLYCACLLFAALGVLLVLLIGTQLREKDSDNSPYKFSWRYLWKDNLRRITANILAIIITLRFMTELTGWELTVWKGFLVGTAWDSILLFIKQKTSWLDPKYKDDK